MKATELAPARPSATEINREAVPSAAKDSVAVNLLGLVLGLVLGLTTAAGIIKGGLWLCQKMAQMF